MSKNVIIGIVVALVLVVGGYLAYSNSHKGGENAEMQSGELASGNNMESSGKKVAFSEFVKKGGSYKCEVKQSMSDMDNSGTVYVSGSNMRGEFSTIAEGRTMTSSFIMKDGYTYNWSGNMGVKMKMAAQASSPEAQATYSWSADQVGDYNCESWSADQSKFELPSSVKFTAIGSMQ